MISENIRSIRKRKRIKQSDIAKALGIEPNNYPRVEKRDKRLTIEMLEKIAIALNVSVVELIDQGTSRESQRIKELEDKVVRLRAANKLLRRRTELIYRMLKSTSKAHNDLVDLYNSEVADDEEDEIEYEELKAQARELGIMVDDENEVLDD